MKTSKRPANIEIAIKKIRAESHARVLDRGLVQFRLDKNYMGELLKIADDKGLGYGVLARMWICERLEQERSTNYKNAYTPQTNAIRRLVKEEIAKALETTKLRRRK
jgi:hypothetical protein